MKKIKNIIIAVLIIIIIGLILYIINNSNKCNNKTSNNKISVNHIFSKENNTKIDKETALQIGKEKYEYINDLFSCKSKSIKTDGKTYDLDEKTDSDYLIENKDGDYSLITNISEIKKTLNNNTYYKWLDSENVYYEGNDKVYTDNDCSYAEQNNYTITVDRIYNDLITYNITEQITIDEDDEEEKQVTIYTNFEITKVKNKWIISEFLLPDDITD